MKAMGFCAVDFTFTVLCKALDSLSIENFYWTRFLRTGGIQGEIGTDNLTIGPEITNDPNFKKDIK